MMKILQSKVANAIDLIHSVRFIAGTRQEDTELHGLHSIASLAKEPMHLRVFQKHGISSALVAKALRKGVVIAVLVGGK
jgi:hypothetical protein